MILRVSKLQTGWMFVAPTATGHYRDFEVTGSRRYLSKPKIAGDFVLPIPPCGARPLPALTHDTTTYYASNYGFNLLLACLIPKSAESGIRSFRGCVSHGYATEGFVWQSKHTSRKCGLVEAVIYSTYIE